MIYGLAYSVSLRCDVQNLISRTFLRTSVRNCGNQAVLASWAAGFKPRIFRIGILGVPLPEGKRMALAQFCIRTMISAKRMIGWRSENDLWCRRLACTAQPGRLDSVCAAAGQCMRGGRTVQPGRPRHKDAKAILGQPRSGRTFSFARPPRQGGTDGWEVTPFGLPIFPAVHCGEDGSSPQGGHSFAQARATPWRLNRARSRPTAQGAEDSSRNGWPVGPKRDSRCPRPVHRSSNAAPAARSGRQNPACRRIGASRE